MKLTYIKQGAEPVGDGGDQYTGLDRFGRVIDQRWIKNNGAALERVDYGYSRASNRQWRWNRVAANGQDEYYNYDGLYQVAELNRGTLNSGKTAISGTPSWTEDFTYDPIGNWNNYLTKVAGTTDLDQTRTHNTANETVEIDGSTATVGHDLAGNMVKVPQVADWEATNELKWDAWNRLVTVADGETPVAAYRYDGITRRISKETDAIRHYYYSSRWQILEERVDSETAAERQFVWGERYVDDLVLRDRDVDDDGSMDERLYVLSDYFNPTAIADEDGTVLERYGYNAFGLSRVMDADFAPRSSSDFDWETRYGAYRYDSETGFYQVRFRYLHPTLGRWLSRDPICESNSINLYAYCTNSTVNYSDPLGLLTEWGKELLKKFPKDGTLDLFISGVDAILAPTFGIKLALYNMIRLQSEGAVETTVAQNLLKNLLGIYKGGNTIKTYVMPLGEVVQSDVKFSLLTSAAFTNDIANEGDPTGKTYHIQAEARTRSTLGNFTAVATVNSFKRCGTKCWTATGTFVVKDRYDFNYDPREAQRALTDYVNQRDGGPYEKRSRDAELKTVIMSRVVAKGWGEEFDVTSDKVPFMQKHDDSFARINK